MCFPRLEHLPPRVVPNPMIDLLSTALNRAAPIDNTDDPDPVLLPATTTETTAVEVAMIEDMDAIVRIRPLPAVATLPEEAVDVIDLPFVEEETVEEMIILRPLRSNPALSASSSADRERTFDVLKLTLTAVCNFWLLLMVAHSASAVLQDLVLAVLK